MPGLHRRLWAASQPSRLSEGKPASVRRARDILILKCDEIGDVVLVTGFLRRIRRECPDARITIVLRSACVPLIQPLGVADVIIEIPEFWRVFPLRLRALFQICLSARRTWKGTPPDWALVPRSGTDVAGMIYYAAWSKARQICAHEILCRVSTPPNSEMVNQMVADEGPCHEVAMHQRMLRHLKLPADDVEPVLEIPSAAADGARLRIADLSGRPLVALGVGAGWKFREWPLEKFAQFCQQVLEGFPSIHFLVIGSDADLPAGEFLRKTVGESVINLAGSLSLLSCAAVFRKCVTYVGNDTGPMHLAAAVGCRVIEISTHPITGSNASNYSPFRFGPRTSWSRILQPAPQSAECRDECRVLDAPHCIKAVEVISVVQAFQEAMKDENFVAAAECLPDKSGAV